ncbi:hypothetical protein [Lacipirellula parvula]|uniref:Uncharacterized protein n=1 Tax=Lacipirellula parvula TaxID=2650471 RepID=A0A5K7X828_9BACT|nr:hypothetical protein [Lacipirellula parvula]BBO31957.1 hypothetical protein PLANPX_1569 [Lacipirellula parvula]
MRRREATQCLGQEEIRRLMLEVVANDPSLVESRLHGIQTTASDDRLRRCVKEEIDRRGASHLLHFVGGANAIS